MKPYFEISRNKVIEKFNKIKRLSDAVSYSSKTNPVVTGILEGSTESLFSIHLENELKNIKDKSRVIFLAQGWDKRQIRRLLKKGIFRFVVDNEADLEELQDFLQKNDAEIELMLRLKLKENTIRTERYFVFGMASEIVNRRIKELKRNPKIRSLGVHFHRKTQNLAEWNLKEEIQEVLDKDTLENIDRLNIGGGLPSVYANTNENVFNSIYRKIDDLKTWLNRKNINLMTEPGRFISAPSAQLVTQIISVYENNIIVNASVYNSDMDAILVPVKLLVEGELEKGKGEPYVIKGLTPCSMDIFRYRVYLDKPKKGDEIRFLNAGAYNFSSDFCELEKIETRVID